MNKNGLGIILAAVIVIMGAALVWQMVAAKNQQKQIDLLKASISAGDFDLQQNCAQQAQSFFDYFVTDPSDKHREEYSNHFNEKLKKCFILISNSLGEGNNHFFSEDLYDAVEKKQYGFFAVGVPTYQKPIDCKMLDKTCISRDEFDAFVKVYME